MNMHKSIKLLISVLVVTILCGSVISNAAAAWYWKPGFPDYAPNGVPDFDQKQNGWYSIFDGGNGQCETTADPNDVQIMPLGACPSFALLISMGQDGVCTTAPGGDDYISYDYCGPTAVANCIWWLDSAFDPSDIVRSYGAWDEHDSNNVQPLVSDLAFEMDADAQRTLGLGPFGWFSGTYVNDMENAIDKWLTDRGIQNEFYRKSINRPTFADVVREVQAGEDVILLMGFWIHISDDVYLRAGGHFVTVAGVDSSNGLIAFSDPFFDIASPGLPSHNDAQYVSHDIYTVVPTSSPGGTWGPEDYGRTPEEVMPFLRQNPSPYIMQHPELQADFPLPEQGELFTEVEYAIIISPSGPVGGIVIPTNKSAIITPIIGLIGIVGLGTLILLMRKKVKD